MTIWSFISPNLYWWTFGLCPVLLLLQTMQWISLYIYLCVLVGGFFIGGLLLMSKHYWCRMLHVDCSRDVISVLRRAQLGKHHLAPVSSHLWSWAGTSAFTLTLPKVEELETEPTQFPPCTQVKSYPLNQGNFGICIYQWNTNSALCSLGSGYHSGCDGFGPTPGLTV